MLEFIFGLKTTAIFDIWTFEHTLSGISFGNHVYKRNRKNLKHASAKPTIIVRMDIVYVLFLAFLWETIEHYLETGLLGERVTYWFQGVEAWPNRLIADPLMLVIGYALAKQYPFLVIPARVLSITWFLVHVFLFPHSMYLQTLLY